MIRVHMEVLGLVIAYSRGLGLCSSSYRFRFGSFNNV